MIVSCMVQTTPCSNMNMSIPWSTFTSSVARTPMLIYNFKISEIYSFSLIIRTFLLLVYSVMPSNRVQYGGFLLLKRKLERIYF